MAGSSLAFVLELRRAESFNETYFSLFQRAASKRSECNKIFVKDTLLVLFCFVLFFLEWEFSFESFLCACLFLF